MDSNTKILFRHLLYDAHSCISIRFNGAGLWRWRFVFHSPDFSGNILDSRFGFWHFRFYLKQEK